MITPEQLMTFKKISGKHQLPIEPLNKTHEKNNFDISKIGIWLEILQHIYGLITTNCQNIIHKLQKYMKEKELILNNS